MDYTTLFPERKEGQEQPPKGLQSLYEVCQQVVDGRGVRGKPLKVLTVSEKKLPTAGARARKNL